MKRVVVDFGIVCNCPYWGAGVCRYVNTMGGECEKNALKDVPAYCPCEDVIKGDEEIKSLCQSCERSGACDTQDMVQSQITACKGYLEKEKK